MLEQVELHLVDSIDQAAACKQWLSEGRGRSIIGVDTETSGLDRQRDHVRMVQLGDLHHGWAIPWKQWGGVAVELLRAYDGPVAMHNAPFDVFFTTQKIDGRTEQLVKWDQVQDTLPLGWLVDPTRPTALKSLTDRYVDSRSSAMQKRLEETMASSGWTWATIPTSFALYWQYAALDPVFTCYIWETLKHHLTGGLLNAYDLELGVLPSLAGMENRGVAVDVEYAIARSAEFEQRVEKLGQWVQSNHGIRWGSDTQVKNRVMQMGMTLTKRTRGGALSLDKEVKEHLLLYGNKDVRDLITVVVEAGRLNRLRSTYLEHVVNDSIDGRLYGSINPLGAPKTGRTSMSNPNLHNLPAGAVRENPAAVEVRQCFIPSEGNMLAMADYDQVELRLAAHNSNDSTLLSAVNSNDDPFCIMAAQIYQESKPVLKSDPRRGPTKNAAYATLYGAGPDKFALTAGVSPEHGRAFMDQFFRTFPGIKSLQNQVMALGYQRLKDEGKAYVRTPWGHCLQVEPYKMYALVNRLIQGTAANVLKRALIDLDRSGLSEYLVLQVHDEVVLDAPKDIVMDVTREASRVMSDETTFKAPLRAGVEGPFNRWGEKLLKRETA